MNSIDADSQYERDGIDFLALVETLWKHKYLIAVTAFVFGGVAVVLALITPPKYRAEVVVAEVRDKDMNAAASLMNQFSGLASLAGLSRSPMDAGQQNRGVLKSRYLVEEFIKRNNLIDVVLSGAKKRSLWKAVNSFREGVLVTKEDTRSGAISLRIEWDDPVVAAQWANGIVALANELIRKRALDDASRNIAYLNKQIMATNVVEIHRVMYSLVESETKTLMLANAREEYAFTVIDPAVPPEIRISPRRTLMVLVGLALGALSGALVALVIESNRRRKLGSR